MNAVVLICALGVVIVLVACAFSAGVKLMLEGMDREVQE